MDNIPSSLEISLPFIVVWEGSDPSTDVVLLEDIAAILGVCIAGTCMGISYYTGKIMYRNTGLPLGLENMKKWEGILQSGNFEQTGKVRG